MLVHASPLSSQGWRRMKAAHAHRCMLEMCCSLCTSMKGHTQLISVLSWAMKLSNVSHSSITPAAAIQSPEGWTRHSPPLWTEQMSSEPHPGRRPRPRGQESAPRSPPGTGPRFCQEGECLWVPGCSCWSPWETQRASLCAGHWEKKKKRLFNISCQYSSPHLEGLSACQCHWNTWCTFLHQWEAQAAASVGQDQEDFQKDLGSLCSGLGHMDNRGTPRHTHVYLCQQAEQAEPPSLHGRPGGEGACTSPAELAQPGPIIIHLHWKLHRHTNMPGQNMGSAVHREMATGLGLSATLQSISSCEVTQPKQFVDKSSQLAEKSKQMRKRELKLKRSFFKTISREESNPAELKLFRRFREAKL